MGLAGRPRKRWSIDVPSWSGRAAEPYDVLGAAGMGDFHDVTSQSHAKRMLD